MSKKCKGVNYRKKILSFILAVIVVLSFGACGNKPEFESVIRDDGSDNDNGGKVIETIVPNTPETVMDMFDGERKVWFYLCPFQEASPVKIAYNTPIQAVFVTENCKVTNAWSFPTSAKGFSDWPTDYKVFDTSGTQLTIPKVYTFTDFQGMSDEEIIAKTINSYFDISSTNHTSEFSSFGWTAKFHTTKLPFNIIYSGELDSSGNKLNNQKIKILNKSCYFKDTYDGTIGGYLIEANLEYLETIMPVTIKDKEYVGMRFEGGIYLLTQNTFKNFKELELDSPDGATTLE